MRRGHAYGGPRSQSVPGWHDGRVGLHVHHPRDREFRVFIRRRVSHWELQAILAAVYVDLALRKQHSGPPIPERHEDAAREYSLEIISPNPAGQRARDVQ